MSMQNIVALENTSFNITFVLYAAATLGYFFFLLSSRQGMGLWSSRLALLGLVSHTAAIVFRTLEAGRAPLSNQFEFANVFAWGIVLCYMVVEWRYEFKYRIFGAFVMPLALIVIGYASMLPRDIRPLMPALQSWWLKFHVGTAIFAYGSFAVACGLAVMYLFRSYREEAGKVGSILEKFPALEVLDDFTYKTVAFGFLFQTLVIVTGAIWAEQAWGRYWGWDPKETWSLITWFVYAIYLHTRFVGGWHGRRAAWFAIFGFICVLFTYIGVNIFLPGLHSYTS
jgi:cytochrome c-type biogenesis protein CcsB